MPHIRAHIRLNTMDEIKAFIDQLNRIGGSDKLMIEDFEGNQRVSARSVVGVLYAMTDFHDNMYLLMTLTMAYFLGLLTLIAHKRLTFRG